MLLSRPHGDQPRTKKSLQESHTTTTRAISINETLHLVQPLLLLLSFYCRCRITEDHHHHNHHRPPPSSSPLPCRRLLSSEECFTDEAKDLSGVRHAISDLKMDDLQIARATALRDIFGSSDSGSSSYENLGCENETISLADEITSLNVVQEQDLNISSHHLPAVGMLFDSVDELLTTYQDHAKEKGFSVAIRSSVRYTNASGQFKQDPNYVRCRGRPRLNRFGSIQERGNNSQGRQNGLRHGRRSRHGGRRLISSITIHNNREDIIDLNEPFIESRNNNAARLDRSQSQPNGLRRGIQSTRGGRMPMTFLTVHNSGEGKVLAGRSVVDECMLTEEFIPVFKEKGLTIYAKTIRYVLEETLEALGAFAEYESKSYEKLVSSIEDHPSKRLQKVLKSFLGNIYKRQK
ncbi:hypothetical protein Syun_014856 [Stephania yunnanensis]|uniref:Uncharacterized protein n=1 Tax=Stephania yunnanensis TaxID=152371 RepID=A0AAP0JL68_9MAGN